MLKLKSEKIDIGTNKISKTEIVSCGNYMVTQTSIPNDASMIIAQRCNPEI